MPASALLRAEPYLESIADLETEKTRNSIMAKITQADAGMLDEFAKLLEDSARRQ